MVGKEVLIKVTLAVRGVGASTWETATVLRGLQCFVQVTGVGRQGSHGICRHQPCSRLVLHRTAHIAADISPLCDALDKCNCSALW